MSEKPPEEVISAIEDGTVLVTRRMSFFERDGETLWVPEGGTDTPLPRLLQGGSIGVDLGRDERRTFDISLDNFDQALRPQPGKLWYDKVVKVWRGLNVGGENVEWQLGEFMIDNIDQQNFPNHVKVVGRDQTKKMLQSKLASSSSWEANTKVHTLVRALAANSGVSKLNRLPTDSPELGKKLDAERGIDRWAIAKDAAKAKSYDLYFDAEGYLRMEKIADPALGAVEWTFKTGPGGNLVSYDRSINDSELFNIIIVEGASPENSDLPFYFKAENRQTDSPTSIEKIGERMAPVVKLASVSSDAECKRVAKDLLKIAGLESYNVNFGSTFYPWLDAGIVVQFLEPDRLLTDPVRFLLTNLTLPLDLAPMTGTTKRITVVGTIEEEEVEEPNEPTDPGGEVPPDEENPDEEEPETPVEPVEPPHNPAGVINEFTLATWNVHDGTIENGRPVIAGLNKIIDEGADVICVQEGNDCKEVFEKWIRNHDSWRMWRGGKNYLIQEQAVTIFYKKNVGTIVGRQTYLLHDEAYLGPKGKPEQSGAKYCNTINFQLPNGRRIKILNNHNIAGAGRSRASLGNDEYEARTEFYSTCIAGTVSIINASGSFVFGSGDYNMKWEHDLIAPLRAVAEIDHNYDTHTSDARIDFVYHRPHASITIKKTKKISPAPYDHDPVLVTYEIRGA